MKYNIGDLFVREKTKTHKTDFFYISGIHESGQYKLEHMGNDPNNRYKHQYYEEEYLIHWVKSGNYKHYPVKK